MQKIEMYRVVDWDDDINMIAIKSMNTGFGCNVAFLLCQGWRLVSTFNRDSSIFFVFERVE